MRARVTKPLRQKFQLIQNFRAKQMLQTAFNNLKKRRHKTKTLAVSISNLEKLFRDKGMMEAFQNIRTFGRTKTEIQGSRKSQAVHEITNKFLNFRRNLLKIYFNRFFGNTKKSAEKNSRLKMIVGKLLNGNLRKYFNTWSERVKDEQLKQDMNETGPVNTEIHNANRMLRNLKDFMRLEGFTEEEIKEKVNKISLENQQKLEKVIKRWKLPKDKRVLIKCFDHWLMWLKMRKLMKHKLRFCNNMLNPSKCDLQAAFHKWQCSDEKLEKHLKQFNRADLKDMAIKQSQQLDQLAEIEGENAAAINYLNMQRDELLEKYIKSQRLAICYICDNKLRAKRDYLNHWYAWF